MPPKKNLKSSNPKGSLLRAGGRGVWGEFRPPYKFWAKSVRIFSNAHRQFSQKVKLGGVFWTKFEHFLSKTPNKEASPATARLARHTTEKYSLLFLFCARPIFSSFNEKSIFLWCSAFQVFRQVAWLASI